eukprot:316252-Prymnesium_polylepis.1
MGLNRVVETEMVQGGRCPVSSRRLLSSGRRHTLIRRSTGTAKFHAGYRTRYVHRRAGGWWVDSLLPVCPIIDG